LYLGQIEEHKGILFLVKACRMVEMGIVNLTPEMDIIDLTELLIKLEKEKELKDSISDLNIDYNDEIVKITEVGIKDTIDISVSGDNLFYCNGILTKNSFGVPATVDFMAAIVTNEELIKLKQFVFIQLASRYGDVNYYKRFVVGVDKSKMRLFNVEDSAQDNIIDSGQPKKDPEMTSKFNQLKV
jgi:hypothetical protein